MKSPTKLDSLRVPGILLLSLAAFSGSTPVHGGVITGATVFGTESGTGPGVGLVSVPMVTSLAPNNDNAGAITNNITVAVKRFDQVGYIDIQFEFEYSDGVTEYELFEAVDNSTGIPWSRYRMILGHGVGDSFVPSPSGDDLDFDDPDLDPPPTSTAFPSVTASEDQLDFSGGIHAASLQTYRARLDIPDGDVLPGGTGTFTLRQVPTAVPEPATATVAALLAMGVLLKRRRQ